MDDHNILQKGGWNKPYNGLTPDVINAYNEFFAEATFFSDVIYFYSDCPGTFRMDGRLTEDARTLGTMATNCGFHAASMSKFWELIEAFCVSAKGDPTNIDWWHHGERGDQKRLDYFHDKLQKFAGYFGAANSLVGWRPLMPSAEVGQPTEAMASSSASSPAAAVPAPMDIGQPPPPVTPPPPSTPPPVATEDTSAAPPTLDSEMGTSGEPVIDVKVEPTPDHRGAEVGQPTDAPGGTEPPSSSSFDPWRGDSVSTADIASEEPGYDPWSQYESEGAAMPIPADAPSNMAESAEDFEREQGIKEARDAELANMAAKSSLDEAAMRATEADAERAWNETYHQWRVAAELAHETDPPIQAPMSNEDRANEIEAMFEVLSTIKELDDAEEAYQSMASASRPDVLKDIFVDPVVPKANTNVGDLCARAGDLGLRQMPLISSPAAPKRMIIRDPLRTTEGKAKVSGVRLPSAAGEGGQPPDPKADAPLKAFPGTAAPKPFAVVDPKTGQLSKGPPSPAPSTLPTPFGAPAARGPPAAPSIPAPRVPPPSLFGQLRPPPAKAVIADASPPLSARSSGSEDVVLPKGPKGSANVQKPKGSLAAEPLVPPSALLAKAGGEGGQPPEPKAEVKVEPKTMPKEKQFRDPRHQGGPLPLVKPGQFASVIIDPTGAMRVDDTQVAFFDAARRSTISGLGVIDETRSMELRRRRLAGPKGSLDEGGQPPESSGSALVAELRDLIMAKKVSESVETALAAEAKAPSGRPNGVLATEISGYTWDIDELGENWKKAGNPSFDKYQENVYFRRAEGQIRFDPSWQDPQARIKPDSAKGDSPFLWRSHHTFIPAGHHREITSPSELAGHLRIDMPTIDRGEKDFFVRQGRKLTSIIRHCGNRAQWSIDPNTGNRGCGLYADTSSWIMWDDLLGFLNSGTAPRDCPMPKLPRGYTQFDERLLLKFMATDSKMRWQIASLYADPDPGESEFGQPNEDEPFPLCPRTRDIRFKRLFCIRSVLGSTCTPWAQMENYSIPLPVAYAGELMGLCHVTRRTHVKGILQRGLKGGGFGKTRAQDLQMSPSFPWDRQRYKAGGRGNWDSDAIVVLNRTMVLAHCNCRVVPSGVIISRDLIPPEFILYVALWIDNEWKVVYDSRLAVQCITGFVGGNDIGVEPGVLESLFFTQQDVEAERLEAEGKASGLPPPPRQAGQPAGAEEYYAPFYRDSQRARTERGFDFRRREFDRAVMDKPLGWTGRLVRHCPRCGEFCPVGMLYCLRCCCWFLFGGLLAAVAPAKASSLALEAPALAAQQEQEARATKMARLAVFRVSEASSARAEFRKAVRDSIKWRVRWQTDPKDLPSNMKPLSFDDIVRLAGQGRSHLMNKDGIFDPWEPSSRLADPFVEATPLDTPFAAWGRLVGSAVDELYNRNAESELLTPGVGATPIFEDILDDMMVGIYGVKDPSKQDVLRKQDEFAAVKVSRGAGGMAARVKMREEADAMVAQSELGKRTKAKGEAGQPTEPAAAAPSGSSSSSAPPMPSGSSASAAFAIPAAKRTKTEGDESNA